MYTSPSIHSTKTLSQPAKPPSKGKLYIVSTPIGNLDDITFRALSILKAVSVVLSEDTRETDKVFKKYDIQKSQLSYRDQNHERIYPKIKDLLETGQDIALVSDSGTPIISDPGFKLATQLIKDGFEVISIPGPSAVISALTVSGLPTDKFTFLGFLPKSQAQRQKLLTQFGALDSTLIIYESPFRIDKILSDVLNALGDRFVVVANDLTKVYEKVYRGKVIDLIDLTKNGQLKAKGEFVVLVAKEGFD